MGRWIPLAVVLLAQLGILVSVPAGHVAARAWGTDVTLRTAPVDPYDLLSGYYVTLSYEVEQAATNALPAGAEKGETLWIVVRKSDPTWEFVSVSRVRPETADDEIALRAGLKGRRVGLRGADRLYIPESQRERAEELRREERGRGLVDLRVGSDGTIAVVRLRLGDAVFGE